MNSSLTLFLKESQNPLSRYLGHPLSSLGEVRERYKFVKQIGVKNAHRFGRTYANH